MPLKFANNQSLTGTTALPSAVPTDNLILISTQTASSSATISFTTSLDSTYDAYEFHFINIKPATDAVKLQFNGSTDSGSNYNVTKTTTFFHAAANEAGTDAGPVEYEAGNDLAQSTSFQDLVRNIGNGSDENAVGTFTLFNPSSTTYVKHFISTFNSYAFNDYTDNTFIAGYLNTTSAVNAIQFKMSSGNFDGTIKMYGVKKS
jgi:hypothetical protein